LPTRLITATLERAGSDPVSEFVEEFLQGFTELMGVTEDLPLIRGVPVLRG
jgi:hypothetical protein